MHFLSLEDVNELHLLLECLHEFIPLFLQLPIVLHKSLHVPPLTLVFALLRDSGLPQLELHLLKLFESPVELGIFGGNVLDLLSFFALHQVDLTILFFKLRFKALQFLLEL